MMHHWRIKSYHKNFCYTMRDSDAHFILQGFLKMMMPTRWILMIRGGSSAAATSKMERFVIIANGWKPLTIITKRSILDVAAAVDPSLIPEPRFILSMKVYSVCLIISCIKQQVGCLQPQCLYKVIQLVKITKRSSGFLQVFYKISVLIKFR